MAILEIVKIPDPILKHIADPVTDVNKYQTLIDDMFETMYDLDHAVGLAANQVGRPEAIAVIDASPERNQPVVLINPKIILKEEPIISNEGCLSVPGYYHEVPRFKKITVSTLNRKGELIEITSDEFLAIVIQHETDHLNAKVFIDYLSPLKQQMALKKMKKTLKMGRDR